MMAMSFSTLKIKVLVFMHQASSLSRELADTQQLNIPKLIIANVCLQSNDNFYKIIIYSIGF